MQTIIKGGTLVSSKESVQADILMVGGRIAAVGQGLEAGGEARVIDASGKYVLPGGIDAHTHITLDIAASRGSDVYFSGTVPAALGGTTCIVDHLSFRHDGSDLEDELRAYMALARGQSAIDYAFHGLVQGADEKSLRDLEILPRLGLKSVKAYMTYDFRLNDGDLLKVLECTRALGLILIVHAEDHEEIQRLRAQCKAEGKLAPIWHARSRPAAGEARAVARVLALAKQAGDAPVYIAHLSTADGLEEIRKARAAGQRNIYAETCTQYLLFTEERYLDEEDGLRYIMAPPLREKSDVEALWQGLAQGDIQVAASDHCSFTLADKARGRGDFTACPGGAPGLNERLSALFSEGVLKGRISPQKFVELCSSAPAEIFGLAGKGAIAPGADADLLILDPAAPAGIHLPLPDSYSIYTGLGLKGRVDYVCLGGEPVAVNGQYTGSRGQGGFKGDSDAIS